MKIGDPNRSSGEDELRLGGVGSTPVTRIKRVFCFGDWWILSAVSEMSKIGPRPLLDLLIRLDDGCYEPCPIHVYIDIQFGQIPMTAVAV